MTPGSHPQNGHHPLFLAYQPQLPCSYHGTLQHKHGLRCSSSRPSVLILSSPWALLSSSNLCPLPSALFDVRRHHHRIPAGPTLLLQYLEQPSAIPLLVPTRHPRHVEDWRGLPLELPPVYGPILDASIAQSYESEPSMVDVAAVHTRPKRT
ncbi:hypothetical protein OIDMADRAFT_49491 [Oidiodendron maius Zn]|uniref:Uncharacterized protein n=1 Tax=Oidiodendron maius (strain Zn) TaxID=913774 RepID=A0A0C3D3Y0_OIDMZ|nr:hypothetical protein OIDMADRAFT_49491 [Oidiodendron maius Zn]